MSEVADKVKDMSLKEGKKDGKKKAEKKPSNALYLDPQPEFIDQRIAMFEHFKQKYDEEISKKEKVPIKVTLKDGSIKEGTAYETSPMDIASSIGKSFAERQVIAKVDGKLWDIPRPLEGDAKLEFLDFEHPEGKAVFWHSSAHILGEACECHYGCHLTHGPPTDDGFFYDMSINNGETAVTQADFPSLEQVATKAIKEKQKFERLELTKEQLLEMFKYNKYKIKFISDKIPDGTSTTVYRCGPLIDLCVGPHIPHSGRIKAFKVLKNSASYFLGDSNNDSLQRVYGISFPDKKLMTEHLKFLAEAAERDHRKIGKEQELFFFSEMSPGSAMWLPHGTRIYNTLVETLREEYRKRGYDEVITPNMYSTKLWETSGHWQNYKENMFSFEVEKETFGLKPMNCLSEDMRVQTNKGFLGLDEVKDQWRDLKFANYNPETKQIQYLPASNFILKDAANHKMVEFSDYDINSDAHGSFSLFVTDNHDMYVQTGRVDKEAGDINRIVYEENLEFSKVEASQLVGSGKGIRFTTTAPNGIDIASVASYKQVVSENQQQTFLELYGYWVGNADKVGETGVTFTAANEANSAWLSKAISELEGKVDGTTITDSKLSALFNGSEQSFAEWVWDLAKDELRSVVHGFARASGDENKKIYTSSVILRDELVRVLLHAGYTSRFELNATKRWEITYVEDVAQCVNPVLYSDKNVKVVDDYFGRVWCVTVPTGLIIVQRVVKNAEDVVVKASRPTIVGNCPGHAVMFKSRERSYRDLPWRVADFGVIHRNEFSGALSGLTRVRRFQQDDAHIFCTADQIGTEIAGVFDLLKKMYGIFGFEFKMELSTRPEKYVGDLETWNGAEQKLEQALDEFLGKGKWELNPGDGAFYGPKIDIMISDALKRWFQCATIQLDFQLPHRFELEYKTDKGPTSRPVMIHRAILGSVERMTAILTEHYKGKWPFWLSPRQILIVPVGPKYYDYAQTLQKRLNDEHSFYCDVDVSGNTLPKKIRTGQMYKYNFIFIVGDEEEKSNNVNVRNRDIPEEQGKNAMVKVDDVIQQLLDLKQSKRSDNKLV